MLIQITNTCQMGCPHCMQRSTPKAQHMSMEVVDMCVQHARGIGAQAIMISGGEPTEHPQFKEIVKKFLKFPIVCIISDGEWIEDVEKVKTMRWLMSNKNVTLQITNIKGIYPREVNLRKIRAIFPNVAIEKDGVYMMPLGRATEHEEFMEQARKHPYTTSCFSSALTSVQLPYQLAVAQMQIMGKFCHPLVDWQGGLHWSESWLCPTFAHISEPFSDIARKAHAWKPCGKCEGYKKLLEKTDEKYVKAKSILGI